jgi:hypothetical protein
MTMLFAAVHESAWHLLPVSLRRNDLAGIEG